MYSCLVSPHTMRIWSITVSIGGKLVRTHPKNLLQSFNYHHHYPSRMCRLRRLRILDAVETGIWGGGSPVRARSPVQYRGVRLPSLPPRGEVHVCPARSRGSLLNTTPAHRTHTDPLQEGTLHRHWRVFHSALAGCRFGAGDEPHTRSGILFELNLFFVFIVLIII